MKWQGMRGKGGEGEREKKKEERRKEGRKEIKRGMAWWLTSVIPAL